jgi:hypothetical protein
MMKMGSGIDNQVLVVVVDCFDSESVDGNQRTKNEPLIDKQTENNQTHPFI